MVSILSGNTCKDVVLVIHYFSSSKLFKYYRKMDCLSQFVSTLCERGELKVLISYPHKDMVSQEDLRPAITSILLRKARAVDLTSKNYYDVLYAYHVTNNDLLSGKCYSYDDIHLYKMLLAMIIH